MNDTTDVRFWDVRRPGEVKALRRDGCYLPASGWGRLTLSSSRPQSNRRWTDSGEGSMTGA